MKAARSVIWSTQTGLFVRIQNGGMLGVVPLCCGVTSPRSISTPNPQRNKLISVAIGTISVQRISTV